MFKLRVLFLMCSVFLSAAGTALLAQTTEYAYVTVGNTVSMFSIDQATGTLTAAPAPRYKAAGRPSRFSWTPRTTSLAHFFQVFSLTAPTLSLQAFPLTQLTWGQEL